MPTFLVQVPCGGGQAIGPEGNQTLSGVPFGGCVQHRAGRNALANEMGNPFQVGLHEYFFADFFYQGDMIRLQLGQGREPRGLAFVAVIGISPGHSAGA